jgi:hypothetical protein
MMAESAGEFFGKEEGEEVGALGEFTLRISTPRQAASPELRRGKNTLSQSLLHVTQRSKIIPTNTSGPGKRCVCLDGGSRTLNLFWNSLIRSSFRFSFLC